MAIEIATFKLAPLPWAQDALDPVISARTIDVHYGKHHAGYVKKLNELVAGSPLAAMPLEQVIAQTAGKEQKIFNNAAQAWNHAFFWGSLQPKGAGRPAGKLAERIDAELGGFDQLKERFADAAVNCFGSGWAWLVDRGGKLEILATSNAGTPITLGATPLLAIDVWEHAYYLDYQNRRPEFVKAVIERLLDWDAAARRMEQGTQQRKAA